MTDDDLKRSIELMGREPVNPVGTCFDSSAFQFLLAGDAKEFPQRKLCHGLGVCNTKDALGLPMAHAWIEIDGVAYDTTWGVTAQAEKYRKDLQVSYVVEYTPQEALALWLLYDYPGPWDEKIKAVSSDE